jgi:rubrerythrin
MKGRNAMDLYDYAMQMEKDGEHYYRELAGKAEDKGLQNILTMLAEAEVKHYTIFRKMKNDEKVRTFDDEFLNNVKNIFQQMSEGKGGVKTDVSEVDLYRKAQEIEKKSEDFYRQKAGEVGDESKKEIFLKIAKEEKRHFLILENIIDFVARPEQWLENPEWYHLEEY